MRIGITTTVPAEVLLAAGYTPVDLNNLFISHPQPERLLNLAERHGFPQNCCAWIKGIYAICLERGIKKVLCVTTGDCSNTIMLMEVFKLRGLEVIPFAYPDQPDPAQMQEVLRLLASTLGTTLKAAERVRRKLEPCRRLLQELDELTWREGKVSGWENHIWLVTSSDFEGDPIRFEQRLREFLPQVREREPYPQDMLRLAYIGVPPVFAQDLYRFLEENGARVVFNEIQRQFAMPYSCSSLVEQYSLYTYPYSIYERVKDIQREISRRQVDGIIHYVQAFCHRGIGDIIFRETLPLPILTLEGNDEFFLSQHLRTRIEAFLDLVQRRKISSGKTVLSEKLG